MFANTTLINQLVKVLSLRSDPDLNVVALPVSEFLLLTFDVLDAAEPLIQDIIMAGAETAIGVIYPHVVPSNEIWLPQIVQIQLSAGTPTWDGLVYYNVRSAGAMYLAAFTATAAVTIRTEPGLQRMFMFPGDKIGWDLAADGDIESRLLYKRFKVGA